MEVSESLICPKCQGNYFEMKREATFLYTYKLDTPLTDKWSKQDEPLPFLFDNREEIKSKEYLKCTTCGAKYPHSTDSEHTQAQLTILKKAVRANYVKDPEFLG